MEVSGNENIADVSVNEEPAQGTTDSSDQTNDSQQDLNASDSGSRRPWRSTVFAALVVTVLATAVNWPLQYVELARVNEAKLFCDYSLEEDVLPVIAGWPFQYRIHYEALGNSPELTVFSAGALLRNIALAVLVGCVICLCVYRHGVRSPGLGKRRFRVHIEDLLVLAVVVAIPLGSWQWINRASENEQTLITKLTKGQAWVSQSAWVPAFTADYLPSDLRVKLRRIRSIRLENANSETVRRAASIPTLTCFRVGGDQYQLSDLQPLSKSIHLVELRIAGREIDSKTLQLICSKKRIHSLNLSRTNVNAAAVNALGVLPDLRRLNLLHTDIRLADLGKPDWTDTIENIVFPLPEIGVAAELTVDGWPRLDRVIIAEYDTHLNQETMKVRIKDCPRLEKLSLDQFQKFDLEVTGAAELHTIEGILLSWRNRLARGSAVPGAAWFERLIAERVPKLKDLSFFCVDLKSFRVEGPTQIASLGAGVFYKTLDQQFASHPYAQELSDESANALIEGLGRSTGITQADLDFVPLANADLSALTKNKHLTDLLLASSKTTPEQWKKLSEMKWLRHLRLTGNPAGPETVKWAVKTFPNLEKLEYGIDMRSAVQFGGVAGTVYIPPEPSSHLEYIGHKNLKTVVDHGGLNQFVQNVKIVDMPKLEIPVHLAWPESIEIQNSPRLSGIAVTAPLAPNALIGPQENLSFFAVGGSNVNDAIAASILDCQSLSKLTLAYTKVTPETLAKLPVAGLAELYLPGCKVNDEVVAAWPRLHSLIALDLSDTKITSASLPKLLESTSMQSLTLDRCPIKASDLLQLRGRTALRELSVAGTGIPISVLKSLLVDSSITILDVSDSANADDVLDTIANNGASLLHLSLRNCNFDSTKLQAAMRRHGLMSVDVNGSNIDTRLQVSLLSAERIATKSEWQEEARMEAAWHAQSNTGNRTSISHMDYLPPAILELEDFAPGGIYSASFQSPGSGTSISSSNEALSSEKPSSQQSWLGGVLGNLFGSTPEGSEPEEKIPDARQSPSLQADPQSDSDGDESGDKQ